MTLDEARRELRQHEFWWTTFGQPNPRPLHTWIYGLPWAGEIGFSEKNDALTTRNFVCVFLGYKTDLDNIWKRAEHWPQSSQEVYRILKIKYDDCDGLTIVWASLCYTIGLADVRLALVNYGPDPPVGYNHLCGLLPEGEDYRIIELTGDNVAERIEDLPLLSRTPAYKAILSCNADPDSYHVHKEWIAWAQNKQ